MNENRAAKPDHRESGIVQRARKSVRDLPMSNPYVLLACSGGKDSVALAWILAELQRLGLLRFSLVHVHHGQHHRADIAVDAVEEIGGLLDVSVTICHLQQRDINAHTGVGLEEAMRRERYRVLADVASEIGADCVALAHHQTDQAETILLHLMRGAGVTGLAGMRSWELMHIPWWDQSATATALGLWRPLLGESVDNVEQIAGSCGLPVVEDPTNRDTNYRRNAIRLQVLPLLEEIATGSTAAIARSAQVVADDAAVLEVLTRQAMCQCLAGNGLSRSSLVDLDDRLGRRVVREWLTRSYPHLEFSSNRIGAVLDVAKRNRGGAVAQLGNGITVTLHDSILILDSCENRGDANRQQHEG